MWSLHMRMSVLLALLFGIIYAIITVLGAQMGISNFYFFLAVSLGMMFVQYMVSPFIVQWSMQVRYISDQEYPELHRMVDDLARKAGIPKPRIGISRLAIPNAFAFGRSIGDGRVCVTEGILRLLSPDELKAVLAHEISHIKNRDMLTITVLSVIPMILYRIAWHFMWYGGDRRRQEGQSTALIGIAAFLFYFITNLLVLYASRIREYFADRGAVSLGCKPSSLASALYKLVYGSARMNPEHLKEAEGLKAFFVNDPSHARNEIKDLRHIDIDRSGTIDSAELLALQKKDVRLGAGDRLMEFLSTHPNMLKRIKQLSAYPAA